MRLFQVLHRLYVLAWTVLWIGGLIWLYPRTGLGETAGDWFAVWQNRSDVSVRPVGELSGKVIKVVDGASFTMRATDRQLYNVGMLGVVPPEAKPNSPELERALRSKRRLSDLILSNDVQVTLTWIDPLRRAIGVVRLGETNVNAVMVETGLVSFKPKFVKGLPLLDQYALVRADRKAREQKLSSAN